MVCVNPATARCPAGCAVCRRPRRSRPVDSQHLAPWVIEGVAARDPDAVALAYEALADPLFRYLLSRCGDVTLAEDLVEATFLELVEAAPRITGGTSGLRAWLFRAARNNLIDHSRKARRRGDTTLDDRRDLTRASTEAGPEALAVAAETAATVRAALTDLSPDQQEVLALRFAAGLTGPEIAAITGRTVGSVKALQHRGLRSLKRALDARGEVEGLT